MARKSGETIRRKRRPTIVLALGHDEDMAQGVLEVARELDWDILDVNFWGGTIPSDLTPAGAVVSLLPTDPLVVRLRERRCPVVRIGRLSHPLDDEVPAVLIDLAARGRLAAEHFAERGFHDIGYVGHDPWSDAHAVYKGLQTRARELGCDCHLLRLKSRGGRNHEEKAAIFARRARMISDWLADLPKPVGVLGYHDRMAGFITTACLGAGLAVPEHVAVMGIGNDRFCCIAAPVELSSIDGHGEEQGRQAALLLQRLMAGEPPPAKPLMIEPKGVIERRSTDVLAVPDPIVARAMRFMWDNLDIDMSVTDVAEEVNVSRRKLERAFQRTLGRGVNAELRRKRLEVCCEILRTTDLTIAEIAPRVGFRSKDYLHQAFRKAFGISPRRYRLQHSGEEAGH